MQFRPPLNLDMSSKTSGTLPDGRTLPLAWDHSTGKIMMKVAPYMPWNNNDNHKAARKLADAGGIYLAIGDEWFRGVWIEAPEDIFDADYTRKQQLALSRGGGRSMLLDATTAAPLGLTSGGGGMQKVGSTLEGEYEEVDDDEDEETDNGEAEAEPETDQETAAAKRSKKAKRRR